MHVQQRIQSQHKLNSFQQIIKERFENAVDIYYETSVHKKFLADMYAVIPKGRKCAIWFIHKQCWMFQIAKRPYIPGAPSFQKHTVLYDDVRMINMPFVNEAWCAGQGTVIYGTCISEKRNDVQRRFSVENVHYLFGEKQQDNGTLGRFATLFDAYAKNPETTKHHFKLFMPIMHTKYDEAVRDAMSITTYDVFCIQHRFLNRACSEYKNLCMNLVDSSVEPPIQRTLSFFPKQANVAISTNDPNINSLIKQPKQQSMHHTHHVQMQPNRTFIIRPDSQNDIYYVLRSPDELITPNTMIAHIPNYKTSVMMNSMFRNIKENRNLDALEESDDEDEANIPLVDLNKWVRMSCTFSARFKRWQPCENTF